MDTNIVKNITIRNFKSVKSVTLSDCRRINVLIGRPNVGKSNILEALALFDVPYLLNSMNKSLKNLVRLENSSDLFYNGISTMPVEVITDMTSLCVARSQNNGLFVEINTPNDTSKFLFSSSLNLTTKKTSGVMPSVCAYFFPKQIVPESSGTGFLTPPSGANLMETVADLSGLKSILSDLFHAYGLKMVFDTGSREIKAMRENELGVYLVPFSSLADSLQRLIFYKAAIESNKNKLICFEEPEAHTFPPYITNVVNDIVGSCSNQFFITTHSPYVMNSLLESAGNDLAVYVVDMDGGTTTAKRLTDIQLQEAYDNGMDMFFNLEAFLAK